MKHDPIVPPTSRTLVQRALGGHAAIGLIAGALLYIIALSGSLVVIHDRWQGWEQPAVPASMGITPAAVQRALAAGLAKDAGKPRTTHLYVRMPTADLPRTVVTSDAGGVYVNRDGRIVAAEANGWTEFVIGLHEYLHLPVTFGMIVVGALGTMLAALAITGVVAHPRILRDAFRLRARGDSQIARADWHNRLGVWTLPFTLALALTGAFIGMSLIGTTIIAKRYHNGDLLAAYAPIFGGEGKPDPAPAPLADAAAALQVMAARFPHATPTYVTIHDPATRGQHIQILADHPRRLIYGETYRFDGTGRFVDTVGLSDGAIGQQVAASTYKLHFGNFGGVAIEIAYMAFGLALCVVTATGMTLWLQKRRRRGMASPRLEAFWTTIVWGSPLLIVATAALRGLAGTSAPFAGLFWGGLAVLLVVAMAFPARVRDAWPRLVLGAAMVAATLVHAIVALEGGWSVIDAALAAAGLAVITGDRMLARR